MPERHVGVPVVVLAAKIVSVVHDILLIPRSRRVGARVCRTFYTLSRPLVAVWAPMPHRLPPKGLQWGLRLLPQPSCLPALWSCILAIMLLVPGLGTGLSQAYASSR